MCLYRLCYKNGLSWTPTPANKFKTIFLHCLIWVFAIGSIIVLGICNDVNDEKCHDKHSSDLDIDNTNGIETLTFLLSQNDVHADEKDPEENKNHQKDQKHHDENKNHQKEHKDHEDHKEHEDDEDDEDHENKDHQKGYEDYNNHKDHDKHEGHDHEDCKSAGLLAVNITFGLLCATGWVMLICSLCCCPHIFFGCCFCCQKKRTQNVRNENIPPPSSSVSVPQFPQNPQYPQYPPNPQYAQYSQYPPNPQYTQYPQYPSNAQAYLPQPVYLVPDPPQYFPQQQSHIPQPFIGFPPSQAAESGTGYAYYYPAPVAASVAPANLPPPLHYSVANSHHYPPATPLERTYYNDQRYSGIQGGEEGGNDKMYC